MKDFLKNNSLYFGLYLAVMLSAAYFLLIYDKIKFHQMINSNVGNAYANMFFKYFTHVGDGVFAVVLGVVILLFSVKKGMYVLLSYACAGICSSTIKYFSNYVRPFHFFIYYKKHLKLNLVDGVDMLGERSFPSGHSITAFAVFTALALSTENKIGKIVFFIIAVNAAFSRVYLSQHWLVDIFVGSLIGTTFAILLYFVFYQTSKFDINLNIFKPN